jgi:hypothetical protein
MAKGRHSDHSPNATVEDIFPGLRSVDDVVPPVAARYLQQAYESLHAPDAAAVMAGSAVDAMLKEKKYTEGSLYGRIDQAVADHLLTDEMGEWAHEVRLGSNRPRHADSEHPHVTKDQAEHAVEFADALAEFLFVLPARVERGLETSAETGES